MRESQEFENEVWKPIPGESGFKELRQGSGMSRKEFAEFFGIPYRTVQNWELCLRECPDYLIELMKYKLDHENK